MVGEEQLYHSLQAYIQDGRVRELTHGDMGTIYCRILEFDAYLIKHSSAVHYTYRDTFDVLKIAQRNHNLGSFRTNLETLLSKILKQNPALKLTVS